jgi:hypothetical protein
MMQHGRLVPRRAFDIAKGFGDVAFLAKHGLLRCETFKHNFVLLSIFPGLESWEAPLAEFVLVFVAL